MLFHNSLVSLAIAFAAASSVSASITPVARCGNGGCPPPPPPPSECNTGPIKCCNSYADPVTSVTKYFTEDPIGVDAIIPITALLGCTDVIGSTSCSATPICCKNVNQNGLVNIACSPINVNA